MAMGWKNDSWENDVAPGQAHLEANGLGSSLSGCGRRVDLKLSADF